MAAKQIRSSIIGIAQAVEDKLKLDLDWGTERIIWWHRERLPAEPNQADSVLYLKFRAATDTFEGWQGAGTHNTKVQRLLDVALKVRSRTSTTDDKNWAFAETLGYFALEESVCLSLVSFRPRDSAQNLLTTQPVSLVGATEAKNMTGAPNWGDGVMTFKFIYQLILDLQQ